MQTAKNIQTLRNGGFMEVLKIAFPLILSNSCHAANMFVDRLMLTQHSKEASAAALTGGLTHFTIACLLIGIIGYTGTFVAQYDGARHRDRIGSAIWQGTWLALAGSVLLGTGYWWCKPLFEMFAHEPGVIAQEINYFRTLAIGSFVFMLTCVFPTFWTGRGKTHFVLAVSVIITLCNIPLNYVLIFGKFGLPGLGARGAALGTILSELIGILIYASFLFTPSARRHFHTLDYKIDWSLMKRMLRFGFPNGVNLAADLIAFNTFCLLLGCYGGAVHEGASIAFGINNIAFCPILGISATAAILVGQSIGAENIPLAKKSVRNCLILATIYNAAVILLFTVGQDLVISPFVRKGDASQAASLEAASIMLYFICAYLFFDGINLVFSNALRGAGDTQFPMYAMVFCGIFLFGIPCVFLYLAKQSWWTLWCCLNLEILFLCILFTIRYRKGKWTKMRVIEVSAAPEE